MGICHKAIVLGIIFHYSLLRNRMQNMASVSRMLFGFYMRFPKIGVPFWTLHIRCRYIV